MFVRRNRKGEVVVTGSVLHSAVPVPEPEKPRKAVKQAAAVRAVPEKKPAKKAAPSLPVSAVINETIRQAGDLLAKEAGDGSDSEHP